MNEYILGAIVCLTSLYVSLSIGISIKLKSKKQPIISSIFIAPLIPINTILINLIVSIGSENHKEWSLGKKITKGLSMTFTDFNYYLGLNCVIVASRKMKFMYVLFLPILIAIVGISDNKESTNKSRELLNKNKVQSMDLYKTFTAKIGYSKAAV